MKMLHEQFNADFYVKNKRNEGALQIAEADSKCNFALNHLECFIYLVNIHYKSILYQQELVHNCINICLKFYNTYFICRIKNI